MSIFGGVYPLIFIRHLFVLQISKYFSMTAEEYYQRGNEYRQQGNWQEALNNYMEAIELDPESPAVEAKKMLDDILNYYNKDMYNP